MKDFHDLCDHSFLVAVETPNVVATQRIRHSINQATIAERTWTLGQISA
jgi:hypothetical protein